MLTRIETRVAPAGFPVENAADYLGVSTSTVWRMLRDGTLPRMKLRGRTVISRAACDELLSTSASPMAARTILNTSGHVTGSGL